MGPFVLTREQSAPQDWDERLTEPADRRHAAVRHRSGVIAFTALRSATPLLGNPGARRWLMELATNFAVLGGFVVAPVLTLAAWLGLVMPDGIFLHRLSSTLFVVSLIWICTAVVVAHMHESGTASSRD